MQIYLSPALAGVVFSLAYLSTPRSIYLIAGFAVLFIYQSFNRSYIVLLRYIFMSIIVCIIVSSWIFSKFGSITDYISYYLQDPVMSRHIGGFSLVRYSHHWPITILVLSSLVFWIVKWNSTIFKELFLVTTAIILSFTLLVKEIGPYSAMLMPFYYLLVITTIFQQRDSIKKLMHLSLIVVLIVNISIFVFKSSLLLIGISQRAYWRVNQEISILVPKGSMVVADYRYFYSVIRNDNEFRMLKSGKRKIDERANFFVNEYRANYLIVSDTTERHNRNMFNTLRSMVDLEIVGSIFPYTSTHFGPIFGWLKKLGFTVHNSYEGYVYRLKAKEERVNY